jgi:hypothetical protein
MLLRFTIWLRPQLRCTLVASPEPRQLPNLTALLLNLCTGKSLELYVMNIPE